MIGGAARSERDCNEKKKELKLRSTYTHTHTVARKAPTHHPPSPFAISHLKCPQECDKIPRNPSQESRCTIQFPKGERMGMGRRHRRMPLKLIESGLFCFLERDQQGPPHAKFRPPPRSLGRCVEAPTRC